MKIKRTDPKKEFREWCEQNWEKDNLLPPELDPQLALDFLQRALLGEEWYCSVPINTKQVNVIIVMEILSKYAHRKWVMK